MRRHLARPGTLALAHYAHLTPDKQSVNYRICTDIFSVSLMLTSKAARPHGAGEQKLRTSASMRRPGNWVVAAASPCSACNVFFRAEVDVTAVSTSASACERSRALPPVGSSAWLHSVVLSVKCESARKLRTHGGVHGSYPHCLSSTDRKAAYQACDCGATPSCRT